MTEFVVTDEVRQGGESKAAADAEARLSRRDKRKAAKKEKRKQIRKELAETARAEEVARLNDPEEQLRIKLEEEREIERLERERFEFEEREKLFLEELAQKKAEEEEEEERRKCFEEESKLYQVNLENESFEDDDWEYVEEGPPEVIIIGNEIILKRKKVKVKKRNADNQFNTEDADRPTSNPLPPQSEAYSVHKNAPAVSAQQLLDNVAQQVPNFGTEQDKAHCPFHIKTGACRFGQRCSRVHFYPDKSCTILFKNMYNGPGLAWEQDEGLEHTDEEVERSYEEFYEDVHTELLKFGEIVNFKVCRNGSFHLRGNVYVHYKSLDSAVLAYRSINARYFAGKQVNCEFVSVTKWKVAICGEYMKSRLKTCSRGTTCNFIHCFRNPGGDYEWADWDKPPPRFWTTKMISLFGFSDDSYYDNKTEQDRDRYYSRRSRSRERDSSSRSSRRNHNEEHDVHRSSRQERHKNRTDGIDSDRELSDQGEERNKRCDHTRKSSKHHKEDSRTYRAESEDERGVQRRRKERKKREYTEDKSEKSDEAGRNLRRKVSRSSKEDSVLSEDYESERSEMRRRSKSSKNSTKWDLSSVEKIEANERHRESADEILGKRKRHKRKHDSDYYNDDDNDDRGRRSKSRDSKHYSDEKMDRWEPKIDAVG